MKKGQAMTASTAARWSRKSWELALAQECRHAEAGTPCWTGGATGLCGERLRRAGVNGTASKRSVRGAPKTAREPADIELDHKMYELHRYGMST